MRLLLKNITHPYSFACPLRIKYAFKRLISFQSDTMGLCWSKGSKVTSHPQSLTDCKFREP